MEQDQFIQITFKCESTISEILIAELAELSFDSFEEKDDGLLASISQVDFDENVVKQIVEQYRSLGAIDYEVEPIEKVNWNEEWEKNYEPINIDNQCYVRATFHTPKAEIPYEIVVNPKMSFGTGHHATTYLMLKQQLGIDHQDKKVIDIGCGTAILAIMAGLKGAKTIDAFDIDEWSVENARENFELNHIKPGFLKKATIEELKLDTNYDIVLANINRNVLLAEMAHYAKLLEKDGLLLLSGFYEQDVAMIVECCEQHQLELLRSETKDQWAVCVLRKK